MKLTTRFRVSAEVKNILLLFIYLTANGGLPGGSGTTIRHNAQITYITQNNTPHSNKTQLQQIQLQLQLYKLILIKT
jgi:hypothetical protein